MVQPSPQGSSLGRSGGGNGAAMQGRTARVGNRCKVVLPLRNDAVVGWENVVQKENGFTSLEL